MTLNLKFSFKYYFFILFLKYLFTKINFDNNSIKFELTLKILNRENFDLKKKLNDVLKTLY